MFFSFLYAGLPYAFYESGRLTDFLKGREIVFSNDSTVYFACESEGVHTYHYKNKSFTKISHFNDGLFTKSIAVYKDSIILCADDIYGIRAYENKNGNYSLLDQRDDEGDNYTGKAQGIDISQNGTIFLANHADGLRAYRLIDSSLVCIAHTDDSDGESYALGVSTYNDSLILLANGRGGVILYNYSDSCFTKISDISTDGECRNALFYSDSVIISANYNLGLFAYSYSDTGLCEIAHIDNGGGDGWAMDFTVSDSGVIFLANRRDGLRAYRFNGYSFINIAHIKERVWYGTDYIAWSVAVVNNNEIILGRLGNEWDNDGAYIFDFTLNVAIKDIDAQIPNRCVLNQNYPNPFNPNTILSYNLSIQTDVMILIYNIRGKLVKIWSYDKQEAGAYKIYWNGVNSDEQPLPTGIYICQMRTENYSKSIKMQLIK